MTAWIGVDPGATRSGIVLREGNTLHAWVVIVREDLETELGPGPLYIQRLHRAINHIATVSREKDLGTPYIAIEGARPPNSHHNGKVSFIDVVHPMALAYTLGAVHALWPDAVIVPPGGNGSGILATYPPAIVSAPERRMGLNRQAPSRSVVSHARSAWDVAGQAALLRRGGAA